MAGIILDLGAGEGDFAYTLAKKYPDCLIIGIDSHHRGLVKNSLKILKKPSRGGLPNVLYVLAKADNLPHELDGKVNQIFINFPWGDLLKSVVTMDKTTWDNLSRLCQTGALVDILFGYEEEREKKTIEKNELPILDENYIMSTMKPALSKLGFELAIMKKVGRQQLREYPSRWAKRLSFGAERNFYYIRVIKQ